MNALETQAGPVGFALPAIANVLGAGVQPSGTPIKFFHGIYLVYTWYIHGI